MCLIYHLLPYNNSFIYIERIILATKLKDEFELRVFSFMNKLLKNPLKIRLNEYAYDKPMHNTDN